MSLGRAEQLDLTEGEPREGATEIFALKSSADCESLLEVRKIPSAGERPTQKEKRK